MNAGQAQQVSTPSALSSGLSGTSIPHRLPSVVPTCSSPMSSAPSDCGYCAAHPSITRCDQCKLRVCKECCTSRLCVECKAAGPPAPKPKEVVAAAASAVYRVPNQCLLCDVAPAQYTCKSCKKKACKRHVVEGTNWLSATCLTCAQQWLGTDSLSAAKDLKLRQTRKHGKDHRDRK